jgi:hypothetical protein
VEAAPQNGIPLYILFYDGQVCAPLRYGVKWNFKFNHDLAKGKYGFLF